MCSCAATESVTNYKEEIMANKEQTQRRRSLNDRLEAEMAGVENIPVAGISTGSLQQVVYTEEKSGEAHGATVKETPGEGFPTKKATTIMPREVFLALQRYCSETDTPKHRALYLFIIEGLFAKGVITDGELQRFRDMASRLTTTYEKK